MNVEIQENQEERGIQTHKKVMKKIYYKIMILKNQNKKNLRFKVF
jgi:hypothetical protein